MGRVTVDEIKGFPEAQAAINEAKVVIEKQSAALVQKTGAGYRGTDLTWVFSVEVDQAAMCRGLLRPIAKGITSQLMKRVSEVSLDWQSKRHYV